jgi:ABC-type transport system involved in multi-copper enzyme maturation permease subunit
MLGPVWAQIGLRGARRGWLHWLRYGYAGGQLGLYALLIYPFLFVNRHPDKFDWKEVAARFTDTNAVFVQLWLWLQVLVTVGVSVPLIAGEVAEEKERGTLALLLTTQLESWHLLVGKLLGRGLQLLAILLTGLPLYCFAAAWVGVGPHYLAAQVVLLVLWVYAAGAAALLTSVWCRTARGAVLGLFAGVVLGVTGLLAAWWVLGEVASRRQPAWAAARAAEALAPVEFLLNCLNPLALVQWEKTGFPLGLRLAELTLFYGGLGSVCLVVAVWRLRPAYARSLEQAGRRGVWRWRPAVANEPVLWREHHVAGLAAGLLRGPPWLLALAVAAVTAVLAWVAFGVLGGGATGLPVPPEGVFLVVVLLGVAAVAAVRSAGAISGERERGTWEPLLLTPLTPRELIEEKFQGIVWACSPAVLVPTVPAFVVAALAKADGGWVLTLLMAPVHLWFLQRWMIATGLYNSAVPGPTWLSLARTLLAGLGGAVVIYLMAAVGAMAVLAFGCVCGGLRALDWLDRGGPAPVGGIVLYVVAASLIFEWGSRNYRQQAITRLKDAEKPLNWLRLPAHRWR